MAGDINTVIIVGRITRDAELRYTASGKALSHFAVAVNRRVKKGEQWADEASFFDLTLWDKQAENLNKYLLKGTQVAVHGELIQDRWDKDGQKFSKVQISVKDVQLLGGKRDDSGTGGGQREGSAPASRPSSSGEPGPQQPYEDDIPF